MTHRHRCRVTRICISNPFWSDYGLSPVWHQSIIWTNTGLMLLVQCAITFSEMWNATLSIHDNVFKTAFAKMVAILSRLQSIKQQSLLARLAKFWTHRTIICTCYAICLLKALFLGFVCFRYANILCNQSDCYLEYSLNSTRHIGLFIIMILLLCHVNVIKRTMNTDRL